MASFVTGKLENVKKNQNEWRFGTNSEAGRLCTIQRLDDEWNFNDAKSLNTIYKVAPYSGHIRVGRLKGPNAKLSGQTVLDRCNTP